jgi:hypothetical protein
MMKVYQLPGFLCFIVLLAGCSNSAVDYNNALVKIQKELEPKLLSFSARLSSDADSVNTTVLLQECASLQTLTESKIAEINKMKVPGGGEKLKNAFLAEFNFVVDMCKNVKIFKNENLPEEQKLAAQKWMLASEETGSKLDLELKSAQKEFAKDKNFRLEKK